MAAPDSEQEPSIEEILDSIRQIISDDDEPAQAAAPARPAPPADDIIELTNKVPEPPKPRAAPPPPPPPPPESIEVDMMDSDPEPPPPPPRPKPRPVAKPRPPEPVDFDSLLTERAEDATFQAFSELAERAAIERGGSVTIEDVVREEIKPMLREWIDNHLPDMVERLLQAELERISRRTQED